MNLPCLGARVPRRGGALTRALGRGMLRAMRFRVEGELPDLPRFVIAVAPHTSNWDFVVGMATMFALDLKLSFLAKHTLFRGPFAPLFRWMGGIAVDRANPEGTVESAVDAFAAVEARVLAVAPEGTRRRVGHFKSGFLRIARAAQVPVVLAALDFGRRRVVLGPVVDTSDDVAADLARIEAHFAPVRGCHAR
ncbi:MAG TPA: lysophospholipid acyltransferase family protein [Usitatibacter sp.]|nr:lysophospholipid acyltransferase family protein [Usitatibacter sp.]